MKRRVKITRDSGRNVKIVDEETGADLAPQVTRLEIIILPGQPARATVELLASRVDLSAAADILERCPYCGAVE